ncbi:P2Y purinoceptor 8-like [Scyliorhinus canicula]|uniref:P2Y purinoceptor 8-like n=1 Tax=Scyliorhinus canicula TaxID=7830 RepID=UPI0018F64AE8|nr:P2Y purinoceptor 8-like [Scyliorhinus canicula]XP_038674650.1 P2Y purinoceptor 8-like [Scyliorhinus canicula]XP_038674651.1 P2Y purinoceptor 8-like [Scyliorhinus canicula]
METNATNLTLDSETLEMLASNVIKVTLPTIYVAVILISLPGNGISLWLLCFRTRPKTPLVVFMINLTIADILLSFFLPFQIAYHLNDNNWAFGKSLCTFLTTLFYANMYCSILTMTCISVERYVGVAYPIWYKQGWNRWHAVTVCCGIWTVLIIVLLPLEYSDLTFEVKQLNITTCFDVLKRNMLPNTEAWGLFLFTLFVLLFLIPFTITVICYTLVILKLSQTSHKEHSEKKRRAVYLAATVLLVFVTCYAPNNITLLIHIIWRLQFNSGCYTAYKLTLSLSCLNSCLNPFVFFFASTEFQKHFHRLIGRRQSYSQRTTVEYSTTKSVSFQR